LPPRRCHVFPAGARDMLAVSIREAQRPAQVNHERRGDLPVFVRILAGTGDPDAHVLARSNANAARTAAALGDRTRADVGILPWDRRRYFGLHDSSRGCSSFAALVVWRRQWNEKPPTERP